MDFLSHEVITSILPEVAKADFTQNVFIFMMAWTVVRRTVKEHFSKIEKALGDVASSVKDLNQAMIRLETNHSVRINNLENNIEILSTRVKKIEGETWKS